MKTIEDYTRFEIENLHEDAKDGKLIIEKNEIDEDKSEVNDFILSEDYVPQKRKQGGRVSSDLIVSAHVGTNDEQFKEIARLYLNDGATVADITYGKGVFWKNIDVTKYNFYPTDIKTGVDARKLPYSNDFLDVCVFDPPYMEGLFRRSEAHLAGSGTYSSFREYYSNSTVTTDGVLKYHDKVIDLYLSVTREVYRVLKDKGVYIVKCQDEVSANKQKLTHVEIIYALEKMGFYCEDIFVLVRNNRPGVSRVLKQKHARKNHSYFLVFKLHKNSKIPYSNFGSLLTSYPTPNVPELLPDSHSKVEKEDR